MVMTTREKIEIDENFIRCLEILEKNNHLNQINLNHLLKNHQYLDIILLAMEIFDQYHLFNTNISDIWHYSENIYNLALGYEKLLSYDLFDRFHRYLLSSPANANTLALCLIDLDQARLLTRQCLESLFEKRDYAGSLAKNFNFLNKLNLLNEENIGYIFEQADYADELYRGLCKLDHDELITRHIDLFLENMKYAHSIAIGIDILIRCNLYNSHIIYLEDDPSNASSLATGFSYLSENNLLEQYGQLLLEVSFEADDMANYLVLHDRHQINILNVDYLLQYPNRIHRLYESLRHLERSNLIDFYKDSLIRYGDYSFDLLHGVARLSQTNLLAEYLDNIIESLNNGFTLAEGLYLLSKYGLLSDKNAVEQLHQYPKSANLIAYAIKDALKVNILNKKLDYQILAYSVDHSCENYEDVRKIHFNQRWLDDQKEAIIQATNSLRGQMPVDDMVKMICDFAPMPFIKQNECNQINNVNQLEN